jgi:hypothetical protein
MTAAKVRDALVHARAAVEIVREAMRAERSPVVRNALHHAFDWLAAGQLQLELTEGIVPPSEAPEAPPA